MTDYSLLAVHELKSYIWNELKNANILNESDYYADNFSEPLVPIIPTQQMPEFNNLLPGATYIVYAYETFPIPAQWWLTTESIQLMIVSNDYDKINTILNFLVDAFRRYDDSANEIFQSGIISNTFNFKYTSIERVEAPTPFKSEGGLMVGNIDIVYAYTRKLDSGGKFE
jgi:hypothetical protein